jgi:hypothetical protein
MLAVRGDDHSTCAVTAAGQFHERFRFATARGGCGIVLEANEFGRVADVDVVVVEGDAEDAALTSGEDFLVLGLPCISPIAKDVNFSSAGLGDKDVAAGGHGKPAGRFEAFGKDRDFETRGNRREEAGRRGVVLGAVVGGLCGVRLGEIGRLAVGDLRGSGKRQEEQGSAKGKEGANARGHGDLLRVLRAGI